MFCGFNCQLNAFYYCGPRRKCHLIKFLTWLSFFFLAQDGGLLINNPTALAVHESKCLWPDTPLECVVSLGTGRFENPGKNATYTSLKTKLTNVISSATDTEGKIFHRVSVVFIVVFAFIFTAHVFTISTQTIKGLVVLP